MDATLVSLLRQFPGARERIAHVEELAARPATYAEPLQPLPMALRTALAARGVQQLYAHQAVALDAAQSGAHIGVVTATASGKTLCYQLPTLATLLHSPEARALFLFPTKALAHDQLRSLKQLLAHLPSTPAIHAATFDGDTPRQQRDGIRAQTQIILSNPDMVHRSILPDHRRWANWLTQLRFLVLDEAHIYRGVFGSHVALIVRRLQRLCAFYGSAPQIICCSATSANPEEHLSALCGAPVQVINGDGAPQGARSFVFWNPPVVDEGRRNKEEGGRRRSTNVETASVFANLVRAQVKTLTFARSRRGAELILRYARESALTNPQAIAVYRAGYTPEQRRELEQRFVSGATSGLVSTNALELGVDIGGVDAVVIGGYPGSIASTWQQAGRAGRSQGSSLAVLVAQDDPVDQFYMRHPAQFFSRSHEHARVALQNPYILADQLCCAAAELPLDESDQHWFGTTFANLRDWLVRRGRLFETTDDRVAADGRPAADVNIRSADGSAITLRESETGRIIEQLSATRAPFEIFPGAVYLHQGDTYVVESLTQQEALARRSEVRYYTQTRDETDITIERIIEQRQQGPALLCFGVVNVTRRVTGYRRKEHYSETVLSEHDLSLPPQSFRTQAVWWIVPDEVVNTVARGCGDLLGALHAMEHAAIGLLPLFAQCDRGDIGGLSTALHSDTAKATVFVYDGVPGGVGIAQLGYEQAVAWWQATRDLLRDCPCAEGCPACVHSPKCGNGNQPLSKHGARILADLLLGTAAPIALAAAQPQQRTGTQRLAVLNDLRERLGRVQATTEGPQRLALLAALRYRIATERAGPLAGDAELSALAIEVAQLR
jgi:DEAD/DEAH box helicase domain-containing protein